MEVLVRYCELGLFEEALYCAQVFRMEMDLIFTAFVNHCISLSSGGDNVMYVIIFSVSSHC